MIDDDVVTRLVELHDHIQAPATPPGADAFRGKRMLGRRRTVVVGAAAAAVVAVLGIVTATTGRPQTGDHLDPVQPGPTQGPTPTPTESPSTVEAWTPERIRDEGSGEEILTTASGLSAYLYEVCDGTRCGPLGPLEDMPTALEVTQDGRSAVFDLHLSGVPWVKEFDEDSLLVQDAELGTPDDGVRVRLLQADGTAVEFRRLDDPAPAVPGPGVFVVDDFGIWSAGMAGGEDLYFVDDRAGTLQPLDAPDEEVRYWGPNVDEFLWGVTDDCRVFWATSGTFEERRLDCDDHTNFTDLDDDIFPSGWLRPGRMVVTEWFDPGNRTAIHVSLDYGVTWQRLPVGEGETADVLRQLG